MAVARWRSFSDLPDDVIEEILCRLPIKDAARTSILSRRWHRCWLSIPVLDLSGLYSSQIYQVLPLLLHSSGRQPIRLFKVEELERRDEWQRRRSRAKIFNHLFKVEELEERDNRRRRRSGDESFDDVERWLTALSLQSSSSLRTLSLLLRDLSCELDLIHSCFPSLTHLELSGQLYVPPMFQFQGGLTALRGLHLHEFNHVDEGNRPSEASWWTKEEDGLSTLISASPLLETLDVSNLNRYTCFPRYYLNINAPNLRRLNLEGLELYDFTVTSAPLLEFARMNALYYFDDNSRGGGGATAVDCILSKVLRGIVTVKKLELDHSVLEFLSRGCHVPERIPICFNNLRIISILDVNLGHKKPMLALLCLLRSCPNLLELIMGERYYYKCRRYGYKYESEADYDVWKLEAQEDIRLFNNLEVVTMTQIICKRHELSFIKLVLEKAILLKVVNISFHKNLKQTDSIVAELLEFPRASNQARILLTR